MIAHCLFHQTATWERGLLCTVCGHLLRQAGESWYCPRCLRAQTPTGCPICTGQPWQ